MAVEYSFYTEEYLGDSIPVGEFTRLSRRASSQLDRYKRIYTVSGDDTAEKLAICAMADALYFYEIAASGGLITSSSVGSVSSGSQQANLDVSDKAMSRELYRCAGLYLSIYRGGRVCSV